MPLTRKPTAIAVLSLLVSFTVVTAFQQPTVDHPRRRLESSLAAAPSVKIHVTLKRAAMRIHGHSEFDVFARPVVSADGTRILYDGYASFVGGDNEFKYVMVEGVGYLVQTSANGSSDSSVVRCLPAGVPFDAILPALNDLTQIPSASVGDEHVNCSSGNLFKTTFSGANFAVCASGASGFTAFGSDMTMAVTYLNESVTIAAPKPSDAASSRTVSATAKSVTPTALALLTGTEVAASVPSRQLKAESHMAMAADSCGCESTPRPCILLHGLGNPTEMDELQDSPKETSHKLGSINDHAPCCSVVKYAIMNTVDTKWMNDTLQQKFCDLSLSMSSTSDLTTKTIKDTIVVTHSMGGLVMAGALATGKCSFDETTSWVALSPPMTGSMAVNYLEDVCKDEGSVLLKGISKITGDCPINRSRQSITYQGEKYSTSELDADYAAAQEAYRGNVTAAMCSNYYVGVFSLFQLPCMIAGENLPHKSLENDGLVEFQSCAKGLDTSQFGTSYTSRFYMPELNHADTAFLNGDSWFNDAQKPQKWFECLF